MSRMQGILLAKRAPIVLTPAYANTITGLIGSLYSGLNVVSRELTGFVTSARRDTSVERAAVGQSVTFPIVPQQTAQDIVPQMTIPTPPDNNIGFGTMAITKARAVAFGWTGEEVKALNNGVGYQNVQADLFAEGLRTLVNEIEADGAAATSLAASRAYGTAGTTPFVTGGVADIAQTRKILDDNGAPASGRSLVLNTSAGAALRSIPNLTRVNEAGDSMTLRQGEFGQIEGFSVKESAAVQTFTAGTAAGSTTTAAGFAAGARVIAIAAAGTGTYKAGDVVTFAGDTNKYVVESFAGTPGAGGSITIQRPGLRIAIPAAATAITVIGTHAVNIALTQDALGLAMRAPALPPGGDAAVDRQTLIDPRSGMSFEVSLYVGYKMMRAEVGAAWGWGAIKPQHIAMLLG